ncbi:MAG: hypothetical protein NC930_06420, partial [Candidatus Omnitrophica bacterium]|nr:hypothetical protein [Candidatus Omnitrophota bacterium]
YREKNSVPVHLNLDKIREKGYTVVEGNILKADDQIRHDPELLARLVFEHYFKMTKLARV